MPPSNSRTVWSSEQGDTRNNNDHKPAVVSKSLPPEQQTVSLHRESKGRAGKGVILLKGLVLTEADLTTLLIAEQDLQDTREKVIELREKASVAYIKLQKSVGGSNVAVK